MPVAYEIRKGYYADHKGRHFLQYALSRAWRTCYLSAEKRGLPFTMSRTDLYKLLEDSNGRCAVSGIEFERSPIRGHPHTRSVSIDRVNPELGYVPGNIRLVLLAVNSLKGSGTEEEMMTICRAILSQNTRLVGNLDRRPGGQTPGNG